MKNEQVAYCWKYGHKGSAQNFSTDGESLYSYALMIGYTDTQGQKVVIDYTTKGGDFYSSTTSKHVFYAKGVSDRVEKSKSSK